MCGFAISVFLLSSISSVNMILFFYTEWLKFFHYIVSNFKILKYNWFIMPRYYHKNVNLLGFNNLPRANNTKDTENTNRKYRKIQKKYRKYKRYRTNTI